MIFFKSKKDTISKKQLQSLQDRLESLRHTIRHKRERAQAAFESILASIEQARGVPGLEHLASQLAELGQIFAIGNKTLKENPEKEIVAFEKTDEELALEDIFAAMQSLALSQDRNSKLKAAMLKEELKRMLFSQYAKTGKHPGDWTKTVHMTDLIELLRLPRLAILTQHFESPAVFLDQSLKIAEQSVSMRNLDAFVDNQTIDAKGLNTAAKSKDTSQSL
jgi:hypothetical protein